MPYVYSTATNDGTYCLYKKSPTGANAPRVIQKSVTIKGGHGRATPFQNSNFGMVHTPYGVATSVSDEDLQFLLENKSFQRHVEAGFMTYDKASKPDAEKKAKSMAQKDGSSPMSLKDFEDSEYSEDKLKIIKAKKK